MSTKKEQEALDYHAEKKGKIGTLIKVKCATQKDLSLAYTPGVAVPCKEIEKDPSLAYKYTNKGNLVAVVSNGTAVLGLGDIGPLAGKPVMEGKVVLFKKFADVDGVDVLIDSHDEKEIINVVKLISPTYGGINLEDIKAPECFRVEEELKKLNLGIPVFHDDQHGTAIISGAALINALEISGKEISKVKIIYSGAGAAGIACAKFHEKLGVKRENMIMVDSKGVIHKERKDLNSYKEYFASRTKARTLKEAIAGADVFVGVSGKDILTPEMILSMADNPIVFALANPDPEISYELAKKTRQDIIIATGRSDFPNQINNVLGFPFIFRGALDTRATQVNEEMKIAASRAIAKIAKLPVTKDVLQAYGIEKLEFGKDYIVPKPFDKRVAVEESFAVAQAAIKTGVARINLNLDLYRTFLEEKFLK
ncbi:MAG: malic enzyme-like NAD(P)-binding protein [Nanoarchaeota archaeon]